jgi:hypothetical protein
MSTPATSAPPRRRRRWWIIPAGLLLLVLLVAGWAYLRGTVADTATHNPTSPGQPVSQLYRAADGHSTVRAAILLDQPRPAVWKLVTAFADYGDILPYLRNVEAERGTGRVTRMTGEAKAPFAGYWPFTLAVHTDQEGKEWRAWWDEKGDDQVLLNRGGWALTEPAPGQTLLVLTLEAEVRHNPTFILRNFFLYRLRQVLLAVKDRLEQDNVDSTP